jgi:hypothetical protein
MNPTNVQGYFKTTMRGPGGQVTPKKCYHPDLLGSQTLTVLIDKKTLPFSSLVFHVHKSLELLRKVIVINSIFSCSGSSNSLLI